MNVPVLCDKRNNINLVVILTVFGKIRVFLCEVWRTDLSKCNKASENHYSSFTWVYNGLSPLKNCRNMYPRYVRYFLVHNFSEQIQIFMEKHKNGISPGRLMNESSTISATTKLRGSRLVIMNMGWGQNKGINPWNSSAKNECISVEDCLLVLDKTWKILQQ